MHYVLWRHIYNQQVRTLLLSPSGEDVGKDENEINLNIWHTLIDLTYLSNIQTTHYIYIHTK